MLKYNWFHQTHLTTPLNNHPTRRSCLSGVMPWNLSRTWRTLREVASVETARSYENPQPLRETLREVGLGLEEHLVKTADGYHLTVHR